MEKHVIQATITMAIPPRKSGEALRIFKSFTEQCRDEPGCISCHIYEDLQEKNVLMLKEVWTSAEDLDRHLRSDEYRNLLLILELALEQPEIRFDTISSSTGIETIEKARDVIVGGGRSGGLAIQS
ncbi:MAG: Antibiotic biosynthesis monooxygenase [Acidobacteria bacterium]|nr:Antibiotic biosynthesis monooxygenase [Acidobacteriota bacterium]